MPLHPLTHHEMLELVRPFTRHGYHVDLAATNRSERRLVFKPVDRPSDVPGLGRLVEAMELDAHSEAFRLTRMLTGDSGITARLEMSGDDPARLLPGIGSVEPRRQFRIGPDACTALDFQLTSAPDAAAVSPASDAGVPLSAPRIALKLMRATAVMGGLSLELAMPTVKGEPAAIVLRNKAGTPVRVPQDLLAVLGWDWSTLRAGAAPHRGQTEEWRGTLRLKGGEPRRSQCAEARFERAVRHLVTTLEEPPMRFHQRWALARWRVYLRRATPLLACLALIGSTAALPRAHLAEHSALRMLIFNLPPLLMGLFFCMREIPRIEIPPPPRRPRGTAWRGAQPD
jgi:hypothetical protein